MEAQSFGIPVIAPSVGGIPEIVDNENGVLLSPDPHPAEISEILYDISVNHSKWLDKRILSRRNWEQNYSAQKNYSGFAEEIKFLWQGAV
jgi:glycosyltransferase involved in cell wall biosynthesis